MAHDVMPSDDLSDFPSPYRYNMNGTELSKRGFGSVGLVPLSTSLFALSPDEFSVSIRIEFPDLANSQIENHVRRQPGKRERF